MRTNRVIPFFRWDSWDSWDSWMRNGTSIWEAFWRRRQMIRREAGKIERRGHLFQLVKLLPEFVEHRAECREFLAQPFDLFFELFDTTGVRTALGTLGGSGGRKSLDIDLA